MRRSGTNFEVLVAQALASLPQEFARLVSEVDIRVDDWPSAEQLRAADAAYPDELMGLYEGVPRTERSSDFGMVLPDRITLFREPILRSCTTPDQIREEVRRTVLHEIAHHFGIDDDRLHELGAY